MRHSLLRSARELSQPKAWKRTTELKRALYARHLLSSFLGRYPTLAPYTRAPPPPRHHAINFRAMRSIYIYPPALRVRTQPVGFSPHSLQALNTPGSMGRIMIFHQPRVQPVREGKFQVSSLEWRRKHTCISSTAAKRCATYHMCQVYPLPTPQVCSQRSAGCFALPITPAVLLVHLLRPASTVLA